MNHTLSRALMTLTIALSAYLPSAILAKENKPNIVFVMADDLGWSDVGFNGAKFYETPTLDALCAEGMRFSRAYSGGPNCMPTRACLLSGMYTPRTQMWTPGGKSKGDVKFMKLAVPNHSHKGPQWDHFPSKLTLSGDVVSIAEVLKTAGYKTARFGKWHLGTDTQGFDISDPSGKGGKGGQKFYGNIDVHEWLTDASVNFIDQNQNKPFFLYLSHWDVHSPIRTRKEYKAHYDEKLKSTSWERQWNTTYAGMIHAVDLSVKRVYTKLKELGLDKNTLFIFTSDNGGAAFATTNKPLKGAKGAFSEGGVRVPTFMIWPGTIPAGKNCRQPITSVDFLPTFAELAGASLPSEQPVDGTSIVALLKGESFTERAIFWHFPLYLQGQGEGKIVPVHGTQNLYWRAVPSSMIMKGDWKLTHYFEADTYSLYNVAEDISETTELSASHPDKLKTLKAELSAWQQATKAPIPAAINATFKN